jgi:riboflavin kinase/FMN adenylyltransferase
MNIAFEAPRLHTPSAVALGTFDGLHLGHRQVLAAMSAQAQARALQAWVLTFKNHPATVLRPDAVPDQLTTWSEKVTLLQDAVPLEGIALLHFDQALSEMPPEQFITEILVGQMQAAHVAVGYNFRFGHQARGDTALLQRMGQELGFDVTVVPACEAHGQVVSSTRIRGLLQQGALPEALELLADAYLIQGEVIRGQGIAAKVLEVPTANIQLVSDRKALPAYGVYACTVRLPGERVQRPGILNLGLRPTFAGKTLSLEVYLMDFSGDLYGQTLEVYPRQRIRPEQRFDGPEALKAQIHQDIARARELLAVTLD